MFLIFLDGQMSRLNYFISIRLRWGRASMKACNFSLECNYPKIPLALLDSGDCSEDKVFETRTVPEQI